jgi:APA family basic amino acid/polyamine antiporter
MLPVPAIAGAILMAAGWISVVLLRQGARDLGFGWMAFGLIAYVVYRRYVEGTSLTEVVEVPASALHKDVEEAEYETILVPVFGTELDDDIVSTAGRLADAADEPGERNPKIEVIYVMDLPLTVPLSAKPPKDRQDEANQALERATEVGSEYETVDVDTAVVKARSIGAGIVEEARRRNVELIVMGAEPPSRVRGGDVLGGTGKGLPPEIGEATQYVLSKAPCRVLVTAPAASADGAEMGNGTDAAAG